MSSFCYDPLNSAADEIRILTIWPGAFDDPIKIKISHSPLIPPPQKDSTVRSVHEIRQTLPENEAWNVYDTIDDRVLFVNDDTRETSWNHPNSAISRNSYDREAVPNPTAQPLYEALSYTWGDPSSTTTVEVVEIPGQMQIQCQNSLKIGHNLEEALRYLRYPTVPDHVDRRIMYQPRGYTGT
ncbi:HET-domain-containing protein [Fusarium austroafricanum]|uniref:HET-domain-containing protein n=1 Tax=Fusarium austroafricanum TaxID=2364996 RepID=A0A8H4JFY4_9HYPO|nr:HET-domain-containing protein [Fusarium austroafricanum]